MFVRRIELFQFRNYQELQLEFTQSLNVFVGENAQGKTNLLEAIYLLALGRSYRTTNDDDLIGWGASFARVRAETERRWRGTPHRDRPQAAGGERDQGGRRELAAPLRPAWDAQRVVFSPDDLQLVKGSPALRRRFLDIEIAQVSPAYRHYFTRYQRVLRQRNNLLKAVYGGHVVETYP